MYDTEKVAKAFDILKDAMVADNPEQPGSYAHGWHCNIAMAVYDSMPEGQKNINVANEAATRFMKLCFDVNTRQ